MDFKSFIYECDLSSLDNGIVSEQHTLKLKMFVASELQRNCVSEQNSFASKLHFILAEHPFKLSLSHITLPTQTSLSHICVEKKKRCIYHYYFGQPQNSEYGLRSWMKSVRCREDLSQVSDL